MSDRNVYRDAERYRWLRDRPSLILWDFWPTGSIPLETIISPEFMDEAIDAALEGQTRNVDSAPTSGGGVPDRQVYWLAKALLTQLDAVKDAPWLTGALGVSNAMTLLQSALAEVRESPNQASEPNKQTVVEGQKADSGRDLTDGAK